MAGRGGKHWELPEADAVCALGKRPVGLPTVKLEGLLYRAVPERHLAKPAAQPLFWLASLSGARFTPRHGPAGLYLAEDPATCLTEIRAVILTGAGPSGVARFDPVVIVSVQARLGRVLDLTSAATRRALGLTQANVHCDWEGEMDSYLRGQGSMPRTQLLALAVHGLKLFSGIRYRSARYKNGINLVVFPDRLEPGRDRLAVNDSSRRLQQVLP